MKRIDLYDQRYSAKEYYWSKEPSKLCNSVLEHIKPTSKYHPKLIDLGCGEGRNIIHFAEQGFKVYGLDLSEPGLIKANKWAKDVGVKITTIHADIIEYKLKENYDVVFSTGTLQYIPKILRKERIQNYKDHTSPNGINAISVLVEKPFIPRAPDTGPYRSAFKSGELLSYYWDWEILYCMERIFDDMSGGIPHKHAMNWIIARRYKDVK